MLTVAEVSQRLRLGPATVYSLLRSGAIPHYRFGRRVVVAEADVADHLARCRCEGGMRREVKLKYIRM